MNILLAEDDSDCQRLLRDLLADRPEITLTCATNGAEAWWHLSDPESRFNLVITDVNMPSVSGLQLLQRMRRTSRLQHVPVIVCSGLKDRQVVQDAVSLDAAHYVLKPYLPQAMRSKIDKILLGAKC
ncbi:MAG TPA: response regulator [Candidatus Synoicihabitans sp.]|nr:response regulator [Candidatus Synoicihabitans sp.]